MHDHQHFCECEACLHGQRPSAKELERMKRSVRWAHGFIGKICTVSTCAHWDGITNMNEAITNYTSGAGGKGKGGVRREPWEQRAPGYRDRRKARSDG